MIFMWSLRVFFVTLALFMVVDGVVNLVGNPKNENECAEPGGPALRGNPSNNEPKCGKRQHDEA